MIGGGLFFLNNHFGFWGSSQNKNLEKLNFLIDWKPSPDYIPFYIAKEKGFFQEQGFDVEVVEGDGGPSSVQLISTGTYKIGTVPASSLITLKSKGGKLKSIAAIYQKTPTAILSLKETGIKTPQDLYGKKLGYNPASMVTQEYWAFAEKVGLDRSKIKETEIGWVKGELLVSGKVDAQVEWISNVLVAMETEGHAVDALWFADYNFDAYGETLAVNEEFLSQNPKKVKKLLKAVIKGWEYTLNNKDEAVKIFIDLFPEIDKTFARNALDQIEKLTKGEITQEKGFGYQTNETWEATQDMLLGQSLINSKVDLDSLFTNEFLN